MPAPSLNWFDPKKVLEELKSDEQNVSHKLTNEISMSTNKWIRWTLEGISNGITPYIDWLFFIAWTAALILIMYNWLKLMISAWIWQSEANKIKSRMLNLAMWVVVISGVYIILRVTVWLINYLTR